MAARHEEGCHEKYNLHIFSCLQRTVKRRRRGGKGTVFQEIRPEAGFKTADFV